MGLGGSSDRKRMVRFVTKRLFRECRDPDWVIDRERVIKRGSKGPVGPRTGERVVSTVGNWLSVVQFNSLVSDGSTGPPIPSSPQC